MVVTTLLQASAANSYDAREESPTLHLPGTKTMDDFLPLCEQAARLGGSILLRFAGRVKYREKARHDLVTEADLASQQAIRELIASQLPDHDFLGEEDADALVAATRVAQAPYRWIVDPLDGTANFVHNLGNYAVSVALE